MQELIVLGEHPVRNHFRLHGNGQQCITQSLTLCSATWNAMNLVAWKHGAQTYRSKQYMRRIERTHNESHTEDKAKAHAGYIHKHEHGYIDEHKHTYT